MFYLAILLLGTSSAAYDLGLSIWMLVVYDVVGYEKTR
jgi:hypothetical protein